MERRPVCLRLALDARKRKKLEAYCFFAPALAILGFAVVYPWIWSFVMSFCKWKISTGAPPAYVGLQNYARVLRDENFHLALKNTLCFIAISVPLQLLCGLALALLLNRRLPVRWFLMAGVLLPYMLTPAMVGLVWKMLLHGNWGVVNYYLRLIGLPAVDWLGDPRASMATLGIIATWLHTPWVALMLFAGLQAVPEELMEAARVDGASARQTFWHVTLPAVLPLIAIVTTFRLVFALREFDVVYSLYNAGGPGNSAMVLGVYLYDAFSRNWDIGRSSAISFLMLLLTAALSAAALIQKRGARDG